MAAIDCRPHHFGLDRPSDVVSSSLRHPAPGCHRQHDRRRGQSRSRLQAPRRDLRQRAAASPNGGTPPGQQRQRQQQQQQHDEEAHLRFDGGQNGAAEPATPATAADGAAAITLHYASGWRAPTMLYSLQGGDWDSCELAEVASSSGQWKSATFRLNGGAAAPSDPRPLLEFVVTDGGSWDKPIDGGNYVINERGRFTLRDGEIAAVPGPPVLVVSDLDDTMIGDDGGTAVFKRFWEKTAVPRGSRLVYNTGRALHKCQELFEEKREVLPAPDYLITSVGTKVYNFDNGEWTVDMDHAALLDEAWDLEVVRNAAYQALAAVGREKMHFRPPDEQNEHKVTCGVAVKVVDKVLDSIRRACKRGGVRARLITSGDGEWRYLDIVSNQAGKLQAMEHVRRKLGFHHSETVACGDSGNDIAMFEGRNHGILVSNSQPDLLDWLSEQRRQQQGEDDGRLLLAGKERARGILEGLAAFGFL